MNKETIKKLKNFMRISAEDHFEFGELNFTALAETAANEFDIYEDRRDYKIPEDVYDAAVEVAEELGEIR